MTQTGRRQAYAVRPAQLPAEVSTVLALWKGALNTLDDATWRRKLRWMYMDNPAGEGSTYVLETPGASVVGVICLARRTLALGVRTLRGGILADFAVAPEHRVLGPALKLLAGALAATRDTFDFVYGFPNEKAEVVFRRAGYLKLGDMTRYARPLRSRRLLEIRIGAWWSRILAPIVDLALRARDCGRQLWRGQRWRCMERSSFGSAFDSLWARRSPGPGLVSVRSSRMLTWRFLEEDPMSEWRVSTAAPRGSSEISGYVVWRVQGSTAGLADFFWSDSCVAGALLGYVAQAARRLGCTVATLEFSGDPQVADALRAAGFHPRETHPVYYIPDSPSESGPASRWYMTGFDRDVS
jgi:hypothetical protein